MASETHNYPYPSPSSTQQLEQQLAGGAIAAAAAAADLEQDAQIQAGQDDQSSPMRQLIESNDADSQKQAVPAKRKQSDRHSNRGVANLTPEQLVKKRRNDREAQRAIRERTKNKIESLEARIRELEGQQLHRELQAAIRARDAVIAENEELKLKLTNFIGSVTNYTNPAPGAAAAHALDHLALATSRQEPLPVTDAQTYEDGLMTHDNHDSHEHASRHLDPDLRQEPSQTYSSHSNDNGLPALADQHDAFPLHLDYQTDCESDLVFRSTIPEDNLRHSLTTNLVDNTANLFQYPAVSALNSDKPEDFDLLSWNVKKLLDFTPTNKEERLGAPERHAYFCVFFLLLRWLRQPDKYPLETVPDFLRPTKLQQTKRHAACLDLIPWPDVRDALIDQEKSQELDHRLAESLLQGVISSTTINLRYGLSANLHDVEYTFRSEDGGGDEVEVGGQGEDASTLRTVQTTTPEFEEHIFDIGNWSLDQDFARRLPDLVQARGQAKIEL